MWIDLLIILNIVSNNFMIYYGKELYHHGIKGQKWGIRRTKEELKLDPESRKIAYSRMIKNNLRTKNGIKITGVSKHMIDEKRRDRTQSPKDVANALTNPLKITGIKYNDKGEPSMRFIGKNATVNVNPQKGIIITAWITSKKRRI